MLDSMPRTSFHDEPKSLQTLPDSLPPLVVIQRNPMSGSGRGRSELIILVRELKQLGFRVRMFSIRSKLDEYLTAAAARGVLRCIVAAGGDGTVADLVNRHPGVPIAVLPLGTENLLARYLGLRRSGKTLAQIISRGKVRVLDSAVANGRRFLLMLSVGVDSEIVDAIHRVRIGTIWRLGYMLPTLRAFIQSQPKTFRAVAVDGQTTVVGSHIIVSNVPVYGFGLPFALDAAPDDGLLDVRAFTGKTRWQIFRHAVRLKLGLLIRPDEIQRMSVSAVVVDLTGGTAGVISQYDGDPGPELPVRIVVDPRSLTMIVP